MRRLFWVAILALALGSVIPRNGICQAIHSGAAGQNIVPNARASGMGRAFTAVAEGPYAIWWNPGALAFPHPFTAALSGAKLIPDLADNVYHLSIAAAYQEGFLGFGGYLGYLRYGESILTDMEGNEIGTFNSWETMLSLGGAMEIGQLILPDVERFQWGVGGSLKHFHVDLAPKEYTMSEQEITGDAFDVDLGTLLSYSIPLELASGSSAEHPDHVGIRAGATIRNVFENEISFVDDDDSDPLVRFDRIGLAVVGAAQYREEYGYFLRGILALDATGYNINTYEGDTWWNVGAEVTLANLFSGRIGKINDEDGDIVDWTYGGGIEINPELEIFSDLPLGGRIDVGNVPQASGLDRVWKFSATVWFPR